MLFEYALSILPVVSLTGVKELVFVGHGSDASNSYFYPFWPWSGYADD